MRYLTIEIPVHLWQHVDGCVDSSMVLDVVDGVMETVIAGSCVRDAGWRASAEYEGRRDPYGWPPRDSLLVVTLRRAHWLWAANQIERWEAAASDATAERDQIRSLIESALLAE